MIICHGGDACVHCKAAKNLHRSSLGYGYGVTGTADYGDALDYGLQGYGDMINNP